MLVSGFFCIQLGAIKGELVLIEQIFKQDYYRLNDYLF
jgi:hypothetical protein